MALLNPHALWWLLTIPLLVLLYLLRARRREVTVPSLVLWHQVLRELHLRTPARRLERNLLLVLQILAVGFAALALARPQLPTPSLVSGDLVVVLDGSIRMQSLDVRPSRFEAARRAATDLIARTTPGSSVAVVLAARTPRLLVPLGGKPEALEALRRVAPTDGGADLTGALRLAQALRRPGHALDVHLFSHRALPGAVSHVFAARTENAAITDLLAFPQPQGGLRALVRVRNEAPHQVRLPLHLSVDGQEAFRTQVGLGAHEERVVTATVPPGEVVEAAIDVSDDLLADNRRATLGLQTLPSVLLVDRGNPFLLDALRVLPIPRLGRSTRVDLATWSAYDVVIVDRIPLPGLPPGNALLIGTVPEGLPVSVSGTVRRPAVVRWQKTHPVLRFVDLSDLRIPEALRVEPRDGEVLAEGEGPLLWAYEAPAHRVVLVTFDLTRSDFPLRPSFPVFVYNALRWLAGEESKVLAAGEPLALPAGGHRTAWIRGPAGTFRIEASGGVLSTPPLDRAGVYRIRWENGSVRTFVVQPASEEPPPPRPAPGPPRIQERAIGGREVSRVFLWVLLALLLGEWALYVRQHAPGRPRGTVR
jgi:Ca-activated chloride channel family protein